MVKTTDKNQKEEVDSNEALSEANVTHSRSVCELCESSIARIGSGILTASAVPTKLRGLVHLYLTSDGCSLLMCEVSSSRWGSGKLVLSVDLEDVCGSHLEWVCESDKCKW